MLCEAMKWNHLPEPGGIYGQNPDLIDRFYYIFAVRGKYEAQQAEKEARKNKGPAPQNTRVAGHRR